MSALKKKDYYQFCYDENEKEASFDDDDQYEDESSESENEADPFVTTTPINATTELVGPTKHVDTPYNLEPQNADDIDLFVSPTLTDLAGETKHVDTPYYHHGNDENVDTKEQQPYRRTRLRNKNKNKKRPHLSLLFNEEQMMEDDDIFGRSSSSSVVSEFNNISNNSSDGVGSPSSMESFTIDGYVIEIDEESNTININAASPSSYSDSAVCYSPHCDMLIEEENLASTTYGGNRLTVPSSFDDDLSSSGVSLDGSNSSPLSSAPSLNTEIDRLRNLNSFICNIDSSRSSPTTAMLTSLGGMNKKRESFDRYFRRISGSSTASESMTTIGKSSAKSLESLKCRSSTPDSRKSPLGFLFRNKTKMTPAKSDCELSRIKKSSSRKSKKPSKENSSSSSIFRGLKRSNSVSLKQKYRLSKSRDSAAFSSSEQQIWMKGGGLQTTDQSASSELILQQPSPFVRTIFQFVATDEDEMFPPPAAANSFENLTTLPIYSCTRSCKLFQDFNKSNSLSRRHKHKNNLSSVVRTVSQDAREPVLLATGRRICELSEFLIAVISYLDRIRKAKEIVEDTGLARLPQQPQSNRFERLSLRKSYMLPMTLHERFSKQFDNTSFNQDVILTGANKKKSTTKMNPRTSNKLLSSSDDFSGGLLLSRSKSLRNISFGSLRRKSKQAKQKSTKEVTTTIEQDVHPSTSSNESHSCTGDKAEHKHDINRTKCSCCELELVEGEGEERNNVLKENTSLKNIIDYSCENSCTRNHSNQHRKASKTLASSNNAKRQEVENNVCSNCSPSLLNSPDNRSNTQHQQRQQQKQSTTTGNINNSACAVNEQISVVSSEKQSTTTTIRYLTDKLKKINTKRNKIPDVEYWTKTVDNNEQASPPPAGVDRLRQQFERSSSPEMDQRPSSPEVTDVIPIREKKRSGGLRRSISLRLKRGDKSSKSDKADTSSGVDSNTSPQQLPKIKEKADKPNKFSSIRSMFEPLSPSEKKKFSVEQINHGNSHKIHSPKRHRKSNKSSGRSSSNHKTDSVVSLRYSKINGDDLDSSGPSSPYHSNSSSAVNSPPSSPDVLLAVTRRAGVAGGTGVVSGESGGAVSSELYTSSDSSPVSPDDATTCSYSHQKKGFQSKRNQESRRIIDSPSQNDELIVVDVPLHLIPPEIAVRSPKSSPKSSKRAVVVSIATTGAGRRGSGGNTRPMSPASPLSTSPDINNSNSSRHSPLVNRSLDSPDSGEDGCFVATTKEINNNVFNKFSPSSSALQQQLHSPIKPIKPIKSATIAVIKPNNSSSSNVAMVSPIMKSDMVKRSSPAPPVVLDDSSALRRRIIDPSKGVRRRDTVLEKWKHMERSKSMSSSSKSTPNTPKLSRRTVASRNHHNSRLLSESSDTESEKTTATTSLSIEEENNNNNNNNNNDDGNIKEPFRRNIGFRKSETSIRIRSSVSGRSPRVSTISSSFSTSDKDDEDGLKGDDSSIEQFTNQIQKLSNKADDTSLESLEREKETNPRASKVVKYEASINDTTCGNTVQYPQHKEGDTKFNHSPKDDRKRERRTPSPRTLRSRRSRSPTNAIIVRRKSIKSITLPLKENENHCEDQQRSSISLTEKEQVVDSNSLSTLSDNTSQQDPPIAMIYGDKNYQSTTTAENKPPSTTMQRTTADGKPIGYATKIMGSPTTLRQHATATVKNQHHHHQQREHVNTGDIIPDSPEKIQSDLDSYIEQSFRDIDKSIRSSRRYRRQAGVNSDGDSSGEKEPLLDISELRRERRREKNRERQMRLLAEAKNDNNNNNNVDDEVFKQQSPEMAKRNNNDNRNKLQYIKSQEEKDFGKSSTPNEALPKTNDKPMDISTMDTMKEFEEFLRKQERKTKHEMRRLSRHGSSEDFKSHSHNDLSSKDRDFTLERYRVRQQRRRQERKEFQEKHLRDRRLSLGNKWPSLSFIRGSPAGKSLLERKLSLPSNLNHTQRFACSSSSLSTTSSTESLDDENNYNNNHNNRTAIERQRGESLSGRHSAPPTSSSSPSELTRRHTFSGMTHKQRSNSTGHSPDMDSLLQHHICDIEEEIVNSDDDDNNDGGQEGINFNTQQLENFNSNLSELKSQSEEVLYKCNSLPRRTPKGLVRRSTNDHVVGSRPAFVKGSRIASGERRSKNQYVSTTSIQVEIFLFLDEDQKTKDAFKIDTVNIDVGMGYGDVENTIVNAFTNHLQLLDQQQLDISREDISHLQLAHQKVSIGSNMDFSQMNIENGYVPCQMFLKGNKEWSLASMAYDTLIPKTYLEKYVSLILTHRQVVFYGPSGTGKTYIARRIATIISHRMNNNTIPTLTFKNMTDEQWKDLLKNIKSNKRSEPYVIFIDGFASNFVKDARDITEIISASESVHPQPYIICTITQSPNHEIPTSWQNSFKWIWLPNHEEPIDGVLQRFLRRKFTQHGHKESHVESFRVADWLAGTWRHLNSILEKFNSAECTIGPTMFYTCPCDISSAEEWFVDLWNYSITPYFLHAIKCGIKLFGQRSEWNDPLEWILKTYPWSSTSAEKGEQRKKKLRRIRPEDVGYQQNVSPCQSPVKPLVDSETEKERLFDFLRQLEILMRDGGLGELPNFEVTSSSQYESSI